MSTPKSAAIYARISKDLTGEGLGVDRQIEDCQALARELGWPVGEVYVDNDASAFSGKVRPHYRRMLDDLRTGTRDAVIALHADRISRVGRDLEEFIDVCETVKADVRTVRSGALDLNTAQGRMVARIHGAIARGESERMSERMRRGNRQRAEMGRPRTNGPRPFGYDRDGVTIRPDEAAIIGDLVERFLAGESLAALVRWLNDHDVPTVTGKGRWFSASARRWLRSGRISGQREYDGQIVAAGQWPAIITPEQTAAIRRRLDDPARKKERAPSRYLLTKLVFCGRCQRPLIAHPRRGIPGYDCRSDGGLGGCGRLSIVGEPLEELIRDLVLDALDGPNLANALTNRKHHDSDADQLADSIRADEARLTDVAESFADGEMTRDQFSTANRRIAERLQASRDQLASLGGHHDLARYLGQGDQLRDRWHAMTNDQRRAVIRSVIKTVTVNPAEGPRRTFDPDRITWTWRI